MSAILSKTVNDNAKTAYAIVNASFHNATWSQRIWTNQLMLKNELDQLLINGIITGKNPRELARRLKKTFDVEKSKAERLMRTELARVQISSQVQSLMANGFDKYEFIALGDACGTCKALDGKTFTIKQLTISDNAPPIHPNCRCAIAPARNDPEYEEWLDGFSKHGMSFEEWKDNKNHGLAASRWENTDTSHDPPVLVKTIDFNDREAVMNELETFENEQVNSDIEKACVITKQGKVYHCSGIKDRVFPDKDLGDELIGAAVTHIHPKDVTAYSFSKDDVKLFLKYKLDLLRGKDVKYTYQLTNKPDDIDDDNDIPVFDLTVYDSQHVLIIDFIHEKRLNIGYRRWKN